MSVDARIVERRQNVELRSLFDEAYQLISPSLDPGQTWEGMPLEIFAYRMLRDAYPKLSAQDVRLLVVASMRVYRTSNPGRAAHPSARQQFAPAR